MVGQLEYFGEEIGDLDGEDGGEMVVVEFLFD
mgnify:CR=1 FL=1